MTGTFSTSSALRARRGQGRLRRRLKRIADDSVGEPLLVERDPLAEASRRDEEGGRAVGVGALASAVASPDHVRVPVGERLDDRRETLRARGEVAAPGAVVGVDVEHHPVLDAGSHGLAERRTAATPV